MLGSGQTLTAGGVARMFPKLRRQGIQRGVEGKWVSPRHDGGVLRFNAVDIATLMYLDDQGNMPPRLKKRIQKVVQEEFDKRRDQ